MSLLLEKRYPDFAEFERDFSIFLKDKFGPGFYVSKVQKSDVRVKCKVATSIPEVIDDSKTGERLVKFHNFDPVFIADVSILPKGVRVTLPNRDSAYEELKALMQTTTLRSEGALLRTLHERLVHIPLVDTALTPIREIVKRLHSEKEVLLKDVAQVRGKEKALRYLSFLQGLELVRKTNGDRYVPGIAFFAHEAKFLKEDGLYDAILAQVLQQGYHYLAQYLRLSQIVPFIRVSNSYFLPARIVRRLLYMRKDDFKSKYSNYYGRPKTVHRLFEYVDQVRRVRVFDPDERDFIVGDRRLFNRYIETPLALP